MNKNKLPTKIAMFALALWTYAGSAFASKYNMPEGVTPVSHKIYNLHMTIFWICVAIGVVVFSVMIYSIIMHRKSRGAVASQFHEHTSLEIFWAIIPFLILIGMAIPATKVLIDMNDTSRPDLTIKITGYQWRWQYEYLDQGISFFSSLSTPYQQIHNKQQKNSNYLLEVDHPLVVPTNRKIRFLVTSNDVIHSWWVPALGIKRDGLPGFINETWAKIEKPGVYPGQCAELCGVHHAYMPIVVKAVPPEEFQAWVAKQNPAAAPEMSAKLATTKTANKPYSFNEMMAKGKAVYEKFCLACHAEDGTGIGHLFPPLKGSSLSTGRPISRHIEIVLNGRTGTAMQAFANQLDDLEIAAVVTYERNAWGNNTGDLIQPEEVTKLRTQQQVGDKQ